MTGRYRRFAELSARTIRGVDYDLVVRRRGRDPAVVVAAPHGGGIEVGTSELARAIAGDEHVLYAFEGLRPSGNGALHLTSTRFDEPAALDLVAAAETAVTVHGCRGRRARVYVGGLNLELADRVEGELERAGFPVAEPPPGLAGRTPTNLTNRARRGGVQLELSWPLRRHVVAGDADRAPPRVRLTDAGVAFAAAVRTAVRSWRVERPGA